ncbi:MAG: hypothetical protein U0271_20950 [Polyangiaceae bacterium]
MNESSSSPLQTPSDLRLLEAAAPLEVAELAEACVRFVERKLHTKLDFTVETLPLLDHYLLDARTLAQSPKAGAKDPDAPLELVVRAAGAYLGEVIRRRHACWWRLDAPRSASERASVASGDESRLEFHRLELVVYPAALVLDTLYATDATEHAMSGFELDDADRALVEARLENIPAVALEEFVRPSTRVEVLDIIVDAVRAHHTRDGAPPLELEPGDYVH